MLTKSGILVREINEGDLPSQDAYFENATDEYLLRLGVNPDAIRGFKRDYSAFRAVQAPPLHERKIYGFAFEKEGVLIGSSTLKEIQFGKSAEIHGHIYDETLRGTGLVSSFLPEFLKHVFDLFELEVLIAEPSAQNPAPNRLLQKLGLSIQRSYQSPAQGILLARTANRYELTRDFVIGLNQP
jgi:RimJ/RimL family protein N-acetyltransferase